MKQGEDTHGRPFQPVSHDIGRAYDDQLSRTLNSTIVAHFWEVSELFNSLQNNFQLFCSSRSILFRDEVVRCHKLMGGLTAP
jgi:hypothetical protein